jgi:L-fuculose-phosphate aldolase
VLLSNHGALTVGSDVFDAYYKMETLEHFAGITLYARLLGGEVGLEPQQISELIRVRKEKFGKTDPGFLGDGYCGGKAESAENDSEEKRIRELIEKSVSEAIRNLR